MRKLCISALIVLAASFAGNAQIDTSNYTIEQMAPLAKAPDHAEGLGRAVVQVVDERGNPLFDAYVDLKSRWDKDEVCETFGGTNKYGAIALLPIHMGELKVEVTAKGYETYRGPIDVGDLSKPITITLHKK